ncbi:hypothetical protein EJ08DRAFT_651183 [Tothia fuscella]|uniref:Uncharacterized protein n=1 Tax=Tothia fuscella TaxID=1048955 RepID=A0A9P4NMW2_9PEZI|nr:hypothetical protein EJ08DRAFT_651183 [Tothia fuscella]
MPTNRPFFSSFLSAFRAHSSIQKAATTSPSTLAGTQTSSFQTTTTTSTNNSSNTTTAPSPNRSITTKANSNSTNATTVAIQAAGQFQPTRQHSASPYSRSPGSPGSTSALSPIQSRGRRGSDSSSEGFKDVSGTEKWYIGGRTAAGEERFYKLSMVKRPRSIDRLSLDRMSL